jgi:hypothetical protein
MIDANVPPPRSGRTAPTYSAESYSAESFCQSSNE